jgi:hypothetical protein
LCLFYAAAGYVKIAEVALDAAVVKLGEPFVAV